jgi:hypothetical protein
MSDEERAAVDGDVQALDCLLERLKEVATPGECQQLRQPLIPASSLFPAQRFAAKFAEEEMEPGQDK